MRSQYNISVTSTDDSDTASEYLPSTGGMASFQLDLSSEVDITGSESDSSNSELVMSLDSEPESESSCGEEGEGGMSSFPYPEILSRGNEEDFVDVTEDALDLTNGRCALSSTPVQSTCNNCRSSRRAPLLVNRGHTLNSSEDNSSSDESTGVFSKRQKHLSSNRDLFSPSSSDTSIVIMGQSLAMKRLRENLHGMFSDESEVGSAGDLEGKVGEGKGKSPLLKSGAKNSRKKLHFQRRATEDGGSLDSSGALPCTGRDPTAFSDTIVLSSDDDEKPVGVSVQHRSRSAALMNGHAANEAVLSSDGEGLRHVMPLVQQGACGASAALLNGCAPMSGSPSQTGSATLAGRKRGSSGSVPTQKRPRKKCRRKIIQHWRRVQNIKKNRKRKKRSRVTARRAAGGTRARARTAATHTPRQNAMRAAVRESYRHDNHMEGLEWARAILASASSATPPHRRSNIFQNFPVPTSGYVDRTSAASMMKRLEDMKRTSQDLLTRDSSPPASRMYGFTPSRKQRIRPSHVSSVTPTASNPTSLGRNRSLHFPSSVPQTSGSAVLKKLATDLTLRKSKLPRTSSKPLPSTKNCASPSKKYPAAQQQMLKEAACRLAKRPRVLIIPVKCRSRRASAAADGDGGSLSSSSEPVTASSADPLGDMWRGLKTLEDKKSVIRRDGTIVPSSGMW